MVSCRRTETETGRDRDKRTHTHTHTQNCLCIGAHELEGNLKSYRNTGVYAGW